MRTIRITLFLVFVCFFTISCKKEKLFNEINQLTGTDVIEINSSNVSGNIGKIFSKYIYLTAPNGKRIHVFGTSGVSDAQMKYARKIFNSYFTTNGELYSSSAKTIIANSMGNKRTALVFFDTQEQYEANIGKVSSIGFNVQDLYASESLNSGNRDASYEEILHLVHNYGIAPTLFEFQHRLQQANDNAIANGIWTPWGDLPKADYEDEYFAGLMDTYLNLWKGTGSSFGGGSYLPSSKEEMKTRDPNGYKLIRDLFGNIKPVQ